MSDDERAAEEERESRRPRVVDKRISSRPASPAPASEAPPTDTPVPEAPPEPAPPAVEETPSPSVETPAPPPPVEGGEPPVWTPQQEEEARRIAEEIVRTPGVEWVVNTAVTLANVSATKLEFGDPADAQLTIDALAALLNGLGSRMQDAEAPLKQTLAQLQLAYAQRIAGPPEQG